MKHGKILHNNEMLPLQKAYEAEILAATLESIEISPSFDTSRQASDEQSCEAVKKTKSFFDQFNAQSSSRSFN